MKKLLMAALFGVLLTFSCTGNKPAPQPAESTADSAVSQATDSVEPLDTMEQLISETLMPKAADELFDDFIFNFSANKKLQRERIMFPLQVVNGEEHTTMPASRWTIDHFFMRQGYYTLIFDQPEQTALVNDTSVSKAIVEKIFLDEGRVKQYRFRRIRGVWMLCELHEMDIDEHPNASFLKFYHQFATDQDFQSESLCGTVQFVGPDPDDDFSQMEGVITDETWPAFAPEMPSGMIYNIVYGEQPLPTDAKIFVIRGIANGQEIEMNFQMLKGRWVLTRLST